MLDPIESRHIDVNGYEAHDSVERDDPCSFTRPPTAVLSGVGSSSITIHTPGASTASTTSVQGAGMTLEPASVPSDLSADDVDTSEPTSVARGLIKLSRPRQWIKNGLVFVAPAAAGVLLHWNDLWHAAAAFGIFCLAASGTYFLNDAMDAEADRLHPTKRFRPVAAGVVPTALAIAIGVAALAVSVGLSIALAGQDLAVVMALYAAVNIGYSMGLKNEPILDLALVSAGFVLRAVAGGVATGVVLSNWFIIVTSFGSLLVVTGKRSGEKKLLSGVQVDQASVRQTLSLYTPEFLRTVRTLSAGVTVTAYCLWAFERTAAVHNGHHPIWFELTIVPFVIAILYIVRLLDSGAGAAPEELAIHDHRLQIFALSWIVLFAVATYT
jgi:decaprenyl-phosphate phosphoribosyltransferase